VLFLLAFLGGCAHEPFQRPPLPILNSPNPQAIRDNFARAIPEQFTSDDTVIIQAPFRDDMAVLGVLHVDRKAGTFELYGLSHMGIQFFHLGGDRNTTAVRFAVPPLMEHKDLLLSIARDIQRMYFDLVPTEASKIDVRPTKVLFRGKSSEGTVVAEFGGDPLVLLEKRLDGFWGTIWRVSYYDYRPASGKLYPRAIVMDNRRYHYRIIVKNRDWSVESE
jgi:hypothetical protein